MKTRIVSALNNPQYDLINNLAIAYAHEPERVIYDHDYREMILHSEHDFFLDAFEAVKTSADIKMVKDMDYFVEQWLGGLSGPSKMPWFSWSTPAQLCNVGSRLRQIEDSTCSGCYALDGNYHRPNVKIALLRRWLMYKASPTIWYKAFQSFFQFHSFRSKTQLYFRWFDSGDLIDYRQFQAICLIARAAPKVKFWLPSRELSIINQAGEHDIPENLIVRYSTHMIDSLSRKANSTMVFSTLNVLPDGCQACPATITDDHTCAGNNCRSCWTPGHIGYQIH
jgi:hypothetical protein